MRIASLTGAFVVLTAVAVAGQEPSQEKPAEQSPFKLPPPRFFPFAGPQPAFPLQEQKLLAPPPCINYTMRIIPAPNVDPKMVREIPDSGVKHSGRLLPAPPPCK